MADFKKLPMERMTQESFEPYGEILMVKNRAPDFTGVGTQGWLVPFELEGQPEIMVLNSWYQGMRFTKLERHFAVTQTFVALLGGSPSAVALAPPTDPEDRDALPDPDDVRAFVIETGTGYVLKKGTWHSLDRYPMYPPESNFLIITTRETSEDLKAPRSDEWQLTQMVDYETRFDVAFEITTDQGVTR